MTAILLCAGPMPDADGGQSDTHGDVDRVRYEVVAASPVPAGRRVGSHYGWRTSTRTGRRTFHAGADFLVHRGTPVYAARSGVVESISQNVQGRSRYAGYGNAVVVHHPELDRWSFYAHLESVRVEEGQPVEAGQRLGAVGNTTNGRFPRMVPHLHFEVRRPRPDGASPFPGAYRRHNVDPEEWLGSLGVHYDVAAVEHQCEHDEEAPLLVLRERDEPSVTVAANGSWLGRF